LKRIDELEKENKELKEKYSPENLNSIYESAKRNLVDSIVFGKDMRDIQLCGLGDVLYFRDISQFKALKLSISNYKSNVRLMYINREIEENPFDSIYYSIPSKNKFSEEKIIRSNKNFSFLPKVTGWYYWHGKVLIVNPRTGDKHFFPIIDSFYVYK
jgi:hypothetical protein